MSPHKRAFGKKTGWDLETCSSVQILYTLAKYLAQRHPCFVSAVFLDFSSPVISWSQKKSCWGQKTEALEQCHIAGCGALEGYPLRHLTFSQSYTHKNGGQIKVGKLIQFQQPIHDIFKHLLLFLFDTPKKNVMSCRAYPHGDHGVVSGVLFH